jgi:hypothetical protein
LPAFSRSAQPSLWRQSLNAAPFGINTPSKESPDFRFSSFLGYNHFIKMGFGQFDSICQKAALPLCSLVGPSSSISGSTGIIPNCYARNIELANTIIFEGAASFVHIIALAMTVIMILHVRSKFTAVGESRTWTPPSGRVSSSCLKSHVLPMFQMPC